MMNHAECKAKTLEILKAWRETLANISASLESDAMDYVTAIEWAEVKAESYLEELTGANTDGCRPEKLTAEEWETRGMQWEIREQLEELAGLEGGEAITDRMEELIDCAISAMKEFGLGVGIAINNALEEFDIVLGAEE